MVIKTFVGFYPSFWQISFLLNIKNKLNTIVLVKTGFGKNLLFQTFFYYTYAIILIVLSRLTLIKNHFK